VDVRCCRRKVPCLSCLRNSAAQGAPIRGGLGVRDAALPTTVAHRVTTQPRSARRGCCAAAGTDSEELLGSPFYVGARHQRVRGEAYDELLAELLEAVKLRFGNSTLIHFQARGATSLAPGCLTGVGGRSPPVGNAVGSASPARVVQTVLFGVERHR